MVDARLTTTQDGSGIFGVKNRIPGVAAILLSRLAGAGDPSDVVLIAGSERPDTVKAALHERTPLATLTFDSAELVGDFSHRFQDPALAGATFQLRLFGSDGSVTSYELHPTEAAGCTLAVTGDRSMAPDPGNPQSRCVYVECIAP